MTTRRACFAICLALHATIASAASPPFAPPIATPLRLTREVHRILPDGKEIVARRVYRLEITRADQGYTVAGTLVDSTISAPEVLAPLAAIERARPDTGLFPLRLDQNGTIVEAPPRATDRQSELAAQAAAGRIIAARSGSPAIRNAANHFALDLLQGREAPFPPDLFAPTPGERRSTRHATLPDGSSGAVVITIRAERGRIGALMAKYVRTIETIAGGVSRVSREVWTLAR